MSYPAYDPDRDALAILADQLFGAAALVSLIVNNLAGGEFGDLPPSEQNTVHRDAHMTICDFLMEVAARHQAADIATATTVLEDSLKAIAENIFPAYGDGFTCEGRDHLVRYKVKRR